MKTWSFIVDLRLLEHNMLSIAVQIAILVSQVAAVNNGLARLPQLGWVSSLPRIMAENNFLQWSRRHLLELR
jgi:hypothetical protein